MTFNEWFTSLSVGRQAALRDDKWMLADAAFEAGKSVNKLSKTLGERIDDFEADGQNLN